MTQAILGAGGAVGHELAHALSAYTSDIRLVGRNPKKVNPSDTLFRADLSIKEEVDKAVEGAGTVYLTVGFDYNTTLWQQLWPRLARNVIDACARHNAKLVFFDNVYAIGGDHVKRITENSPISPTSKKGEVRAEVDRLMMDAAEKQKVNAIIARAPDFFSTAKDKSMLMNLVYDNLVQGKQAQWFCNAKVIHSTGYVPELAKGTAMLGNTNDAYNQIWNLPTSPQPITGEAWIDLFASELHTENKYQVLPGWGLWALGFFIPFLGEMYEMRYQYDRDYFFDSSKFNQRFNFTPIENAKAVRQTVEALRKKTVGNG